MDRRDFLAKGLLAGLGAALLGGCKEAGTASPVSNVAVPTVPGTTAAKPAANVSAQGKVGKNRWAPAPLKGVDLAVARGKAPKELVAAALGVFGGIGAFVKKGDRVVIKPNLAWSRTPETGACTSPEVLAAVIAQCQQAGAAQIIVGEHSCDSASVAFDLSGAVEVCKAAGVQLVDYAPATFYSDIEMTGGQTLKDDRTIKDILECDVYINLPTLKHHSASQVSLAMKNQMGIVSDRGRYHNEKGAAGGNNLHQNIVDLATAMRPTLNILDATRALKTNGPKGPGVVEKLGVVCCSPGIVAVDAYGAKLLGHDPASIPHLTLATAAGLGDHDLAKLKIQEV